MPNPARDILILIEELALQMRLKILSGDERGYEKDLREMNRLVEELVATPYQEGR